MSKSKNAVSKRAGPGNRGLVVLRILTSETDEAAHRAKAGHGECRMFRHGESLMAQLRYELKGCDGCEGLPRHRWWWLTSSSRPVISWARAGAGRG